MYKILLMVSLLLPAFFVRADSVGASEFSTGGVEVKKLSDATVKEIQTLTGKNITYILAIDSQNNVTPLTPSAVPAQMGLLSNFVPSNAAITQAGQISIGTATSGCCQWAQFAGTLICLRWGC